LVLAWLVRVLCDTSFLIHLATKRIKNMATFEEEIGDVTFVVPSPVVSELKRLADNAARRIPDLRLYLKKFEIVQINGDFADNAIVKYVRQNGGIVATLDSELKTEIKKAGGSVMSMNNDRIVLEP